MLTTGDAEKNREFFGHHKFTCPVLLQHDGEVAKAYQANGTPSGYLISPEGKIASALGMGVEALLKLASRDPHPQPLSHLLQQQWDISRRYAMFATPIAYLIDEAGVIAHDVSVGVEPILSLMASLKAPEVIQEVAEAER